MNEERHYELLAKGMELGASLIRAIVWAVVIVCGIEATKAVLVAWSGKSTEADISLKLLTQLQADRWFAYMFGAGGVSYGLLERNLRQRNIKRMSAYNTELEKKLDPNRTSSGLTPTGKTRKGD